MGSTLREGFTQSVIARSLGRSRSTINREIGRNSDVGKNHKQALVTIVERKSKFTVMKKVENKTAELLAAATIELLRPYKDLVLTITADREKEFAHHEKVAKALDCDKRSNVKGLLNRRPRKPLGFVTPTEVFFGKSFEVDVALQG